MQTMKLPAFAKWLSAHPLEKGWTRWLDFKGFSTGLATILSSQYDIDQEYVLCMPFPLRLRVQTCACLYVCLCVCVVCLCVCACVCVCACWYAQFYTATGAQAAERSRNASASQGRAVQSRTRGHHPHVESREPTGDQGLQRVAPRQEIAFGRYPSRTPRVCSNRCVQLSVRQLTRPCGVLTADDCQESNHPLCSPR